MVRKQVWVAKGAEAQGKAWEKRGPEGRSPASRPQICGAGARKGLGWNSVGGSPAVLVCLLWLVLAWGAG